MKRKTASSRSFGLLLAFVLILVGSLEYWAGQYRFVFWLAAGLCFLALASLMPRVLLPLKRLWFKLGAVLHFITSPIFLTVLYACAILPVGLISRLFGKDMLSLKRDQSADSYWIRRDPPGPNPESLRRQY